MTYQKSHKINQVQHITRTQDTYEQRRTKAENILVKTAEY